MAKHTIIADIYHGMENMLRDKLVPSISELAEKNIGICEPKERGEYVVGIHPYDIREDLTGKGESFNPFPDGGVQNSPAVLDIYFMISVSVKAASHETKAISEAKILGSIIQIFKDSPMIPSKYMPNNIGMPIERIPISTLPLNMEEKVKIWTMFGESCKISVFYIVGPVTIESEIIQKPKRRVERFYMGSTQNLPRKIVAFDTRIREEDIDDDYTIRQEEEDEDTDTTDDYSINEDEENEIDDTAANEEESSEDSEE